MAWIVEFPESRLAAAKLDRRGKLRTVVDEGVEFSVLAARIDGVGKIPDEVLVVIAAREAEIQPLGVHASDYRLAATGDEVSGELRRIHFPNRVEAFESDGGVKAIAPDLDILQEKVAVANLRNSVFPLSRQGFRHRFFVGILGRHEHLYQRQSESLGLRAQQLAPDRVHAYSFVVADHGDERLDFVAEFTRLGQSDGAVLSARPGVQDTFAACLRLSAHR